MFFRGDDFVWFVLFVVANGIRHLIPLEMVNEEGGKQKAERKLNTLPLILSLFEAERKSNERFRCADYRFQRVVV